MAATSLESSQAPSVTASGPAAGEKREANESAEPPKVTGVKVADTVEGDRVECTFGGPAPEHLDSWQEELNGAKGKPIKIKSSKFLRKAFVGVSPDCRCRSRRA
ncbi:hypothetical protein [Streptomyces sp. NPDC059209]|uniref:hypothetical protein n=1 Tax=Streptomyces sp. NPDC059209 TaxID=3346769 RepID=UPI0036C06F29